MQPQGRIDTVTFSATLRERAIDVAGRRILISRLNGSDQEIDLTVPCNCDGFGRIRHFRQATSPDWPINPLPILPACRALGLDDAPEMTAQVFQNAACAWRCWYCFVPYNLLAADPKRSAWFTAEQLVALYQAETDPPRIIDLSGGSPDLVPEWTVWMMQALRAAGLDGSTFLWTDDNLSTTYLFDLAPGDLAGLQAYRNYGRVCCFKGFDPASFSFNTNATEAGFDRQFEIMRRLLELELDIYGYITLAGTSTDAVATAMPALFDRLQKLHPNLPLRIVPLEIQEFSPMASRMNEMRQQSLNVQQLAIRAWNDEIVRRFDAPQRALDITSVGMGH